MAKSKEVVVPTEAIPFMEALLPAERDRLLHYFRLDEEELEDMYCGAVEAKLYADHDLMLLERARLMQKQLKDELAKHPDPFVEGMDE